MMMCLLLRRENCLWNPWRNLLESVCFSVLPLGIVYRTERSLGVNISVDYELTLQATRSDEM